MGWGSGTCVDQSLDVAELPRRQRHLPYKIRSSVPRQCQRKSQDQDPCQRRTTGRPAQQPLRHHPRGNNRRGWGVGLEHLLELFGTRYPPPLIRLHPRLHPQSKMARTGKHQLRIIQGPHPTVPRHALLQETVVSTTMGPRRPLQALVQIPTMCPGWHTRLIRLRCTPAGRRPHRPRSLETPGGSGRTRNQSF